MMTVAVVLFGSFVVAPGAGAQEGLVSPINGRAVPVPARTEPYSFWVVGHVYGECESISMYPTGTLLANLDTINESDAVMLVTLGDIVKAPDEQRLRNFRRITDKIRVPVFNTPGNHELLDQLHVMSREEYARRFGPPYSHFRLGGEQFILLDTVLTPGEIAGEQLEWFANTLRSAAGDPAVRNIIILSHYLLWCTDDPRLDVIWERFVPVKDMYKHGRFNASLQPLLDETSMSKPVLWISGDSGPSWTYSPFYWKVPEQDITYVATGLGGTDRDEILTVQVDPSGEITITPVSLVGRQMHPIEHYDLDYWQARFEAEPAEAGPTIWYQLIHALKQKKVWFLMVISSALTLLISRFRARFTKRETSGAP
jgi:hypothetical protein